MALQLREYVFFSFNTTTEVMSASHACDDAGVECRLVQLPSSMGSQAECGTALRVEPALEGRARAALARAGVEPSCSVVLKDF